MRPRVTKLQTVSAASVSMVALTSSVFGLAGAAAASTSGSPDGTRTATELKAAFTNNTSNQIHASYLGVIGCTNGSPAMPPAGDVAAGSTSSFTAPSTSFTCGGYIYDYVAVVQTELPDNSAMLASTFAQGGINWQHCTAYADLSNSPVFGGGSDTTLSTQYTASADGSTCEVSAIPATRAGGASAVHSRLTHSVNSVKHRKALINVALYSTSSTSRRIADRVVIRDQATNAVLGKTTARLKVGHSGTVSVPLSRSTIKRIKKHKGLGVKVRIRHTGAVTGTGDSTAVMQLLPGGLFRKEPPVIVVNNPQTTQ